MKIEYEKIINSRESKRRRIELEKESKKEKQETNSKMPKLIQ